MFRRIVCKAITPQKNTCLRFRHMKPLCPYPCDHSKLDKITICGAGNALGEHLAFMLKRADIIRNIALYDECNVRGIALDLEHMNTKPKVRPNSGDYALKAALKDSDLVVITNGFEAALNEDDNDTLRENAIMMYKYAMKIASICPEALVCIITPPINIMLPIFSEAMKICAMYDPKKVFGVCSHFEMRANTTVADYLGLDPAGVKVPVIGGATPKTAVPLLSQARPYNEFTDAEQRCLVHSILESSDECKKLHTAAPLSTAYALSRFVLTLALGLCTCDCAVQTAFIRSDVSKQVKYFASSVRTSTKGAVLNFGIPKIHDFELNLLSQAMVFLENDLFRAQKLFEEIDSMLRKDEIDEMCTMNKPFIKKTPCPPCPPCFPSDICQEKLSEDPCAPRKSLGFCQEKLRDDPCSPQNKALRFPA